MVNFIAWCLIATLLVGSVSKLLTLALTVSVHRGLGLSTRAGFKRLRIHHMVSVGAGIAVLVILGLVIEQNAPSYIYGQVLDFIPEISISKGWFIFTAATLGFLFLLSPFSGDALDWAKTNTKDATQATQNKLAINFGIFTLAAAAFGVGLYVAFIISLLYVGPTFIHRMLIDAEEDKRAAAPRVATAVMLTKTDATPPNEALDRISALAQPYYQAFAIYLCAATFATALVVLA